MTPQNEQPMEAHTMFLAQKAGIDDFHSLFGPHSMDTHTHKGLAIALELSLYALFFSFISVMMLLPTSPANIQALFPNTRLADPVGFVIWVKMTLFIASLVPLFWALHQSSKRLKGRLFTKK